MILTLSTNGKPAYVDRENISFMVEIEEENEQKKMLSFTRIFLKQIAAQDVPPFVDVRETINEIMGGEKE